MDSPPRSNRPSNHTHQHQPSTANLLSSAKVVAAAAQSTFTHETSKVDKAQVAEAAEDLLAAASRYGKLEDKSFGKYLGQAESYLHKYHSSQSTHSSTAGHSTAPAAHSSSAHLGGNSGSGEGGYGDYPKTGEGYSKKPTAAAHSSSTHSTGDSGSEEAGYGDYLKMAQGYLKKPGNSESEEEEAGFGDYLKMAQGYLKKPGNSKSEEEEGGFGDYLKMAEGFMKKR